MPELSADYGQLQGRPSAADLGIDILDLSEAGFERFASYLNGELGIRMPESKIGMVRSRLARRTRELGLSSVEQYGEYFFSLGHHEEREYLIDAITTHKTDFFREPEHFEFLTESALPNLRQSWGGRQECIKIWSAACSSGEEPYTLAMVLSEYCKAYRNTGFAVLATDVSSGVLQKARRGVYPESVVTPVPVALRTKFFREKQNGPERLLRVIPELRQKISFHQLNLMDEEYRVADMFDAIFLRNVLIYFDRDTQQTVVQKICKFLRPGGYLFVSHSESLADVRTPLKRVQTSVHQMPLR